MRHLSTKLFSIIFLITIGLMACEKSDDDNGGGPSGNNNNNNNGNGGNNGPDNEITNNITSNTTWENRIADPSKVDYILKNTIEVRAKLTVEPGVIVAIAKDVELNVYGQGALNATGTTDQPIIFTGEVETPGYWRGIWINSPSTENKLHHVQIKYGGGKHYSWDGQSLLWLSSDNNTKVSIQNTLFQGSEEYGLHVESGATMTSFKNNVFQDNLKTGVRLYASSLGELDTATNYSINNTEPYVKVRGNEVSKDQTWKNINVPYLVTNGNISIKSDIVINQGADFRFEKDRELNIYANGSLNAVGTPSKKITFLGDLETHGHWRGIWINSPSSNNKLIHTEIAHAAAQHYSWDGESAIWIDSDSNGNLTLKNSEIHHNGDWGITVYSGATITPSTESELLNQNDFHDNGLAQGASCSGDCHVNLQ